MYQSPFFAWNVALSRTRFRASIIAARYAVNHRFLGFDKNSSDINLFRQKLKSK
jgi:hypothetical protein